MTLATAMFVNPDARRPDGHDESRAVTWVPDSAMSRTNKRR
jgi:hypothetical protein